MLLADRNGKYPPQFERTVEQPSPYLTLVLSGTHLTRRPTRKSCFREFIERRIDVTVDMPPMSEA
ncbi:hypothetical protein ALC57_15236 [Trachymyrmex cornetzi]|uniref:Uncharacterized protein n=1 Tax=Trachymyrmex cornetzi TaxID=471704 RepID=A0A195DJ30_9HYME|nr:hypothetical protein ALC57_15236 [Trachymyrmex cornetzi]